MPSGSFNLRMRQPFTYSFDGLYCITIQTKKRALLFGHLFGGVMDWSPAGAVADLLWRQQEERIKGLCLGDFVILPNHLHGIISINNPKSSTVLCTTQLRGFRPKNEEMSHISPEAGSPSAIIRAYKAAVTKQLQRLEIEFAWNRSFHCYPIHTAQEYQRVLQHLHHNQRDWTKDKLHPDYKKRTSSPNKRKQ